MIRVRLPRSKYTTNTPLKPHPSSIQSAIALVSLQLKNAIASPIW
ncbi:MAG: hypothetical protein AB1589_38945 [Cyanobacteriota bacterium]